MRPLVDKTEVKRTLANVVAGCGVVLFAIILYRFDGVVGFLSRIVRIMFPFIMGFVIAFLLIPPLTHLERLFHKLFDRFFKNGKPPKRLYRSIAAVLLYALLVAIVIAFLAIVLPQLVDSVGRLIQSVTRYMNTHRDEIEGFLKDFNWTSQGANNSLFNSLMTIWDDFAAKSLTYTGQLVVGIVNVSASVGNVLSELFIAVVVSVYILFGKETFAAQAKKLGCAIMPIERVETLIYWFRRTHSIFSGYIVGQLLSSAVVGAVCYVFMLAFSIDYALLIAVLIGVTNILPVFGPIIGGVIGIVILLIVNPMKAVIFAIFILLLQQVEGNIITPRILGDSIGISSFWVILSIVIGGGMFGLAGILLSIPVFAVVYAIVQVAVANKLKRKGMPPSTDAYRDQDHLPR